MRKKPKTRRRQKKAEKAGTRAGGQKEEELGTEIKPKGFSAKKSKSTANRLEKKST
jgi:hypothetical protein